jgi:hypothetical protein
VATLNSTTGTITGLNTTTGTIAGLTSTNGTIATLNSTTGTIATLVATNNVTIQGLNFGRGSGNIETNVAIGSSTLGSNTTGNSNVAVGYQALRANTSGASCVAIGVSALTTQQGGQYNVAVGQSALALCNNATSNVSVGYGSLQQNTTGSRNTAIGDSAGYGVGTNSNTTGANNTFIGYASVGASATASNVITLGDASIATLRCQVTSITSLSDARDKSDVKDIPAGLDFVGKLRPVSFLWNTRDKAKVNIPDAGFIAQELLEAQEATGITIPNLVSQENPEKLEAAYGTLIPVLVQAIKELKAKVELLESKSK